MQHYARDITPPPPAQLDQAVPRTRRNHPGRRQDHCFSSFPISLSRSPRAIPSHFPTVHEGRHLTGHMLCLSLERHFSADRNVASVGDRPHPETTFQRQPEKLLPICRHVLEKGIRPPVLNTCNEFHYFVQTCLAALDWMFKWLHVCRDLVVIKSWQENHEFHPRIET